MSGGMLEPGDEQGVERAARRTDDQRRDRGDRNRQCRNPCARPPNTTADEAHHGADRQVDAAADDHRRQRHGQQPELHAEPGDLEEVADGEEVRRNDGEERDLRDEREEQRAIRHSETGAPMPPCLTARIRRALPREPGAREWPVDRRHASIRDGCKDDRALQRALPVRVHAEKRERRTDRAEQDDAEQRAGERAASRRESRCRRRPPRQ